jgi:hypothetical protein
MLDAAQARAHTPTKLTQMRPVCVLQPRNRHASSRTFGRHDRNYNRRSGTVVHQSKTFVTNLGVVAYPWADAVAYTSHASFLVLGSRPAWIRSLA